MRTVAIIPARMGSSRFPGKPLATLLGRPMIEHVYRRVTLSESVDQTYIATCDLEIKSAAEAFGAPIIMTSNHHKRATDRVAEAITAIACETIIMIQGDEPMVLPEMLGTALAPMRDVEEAPDCVNLSKRIASEADFRNPNTIKVVANAAGNAMYMSRQPIPTLAGEAFSTARAYKQVCIISFKRSALREFAALAPTPLERFESIDMLRFIEHGKSVRMIETEFDTQAVDTPEDLERVAQLMQNDSLLCRY
jgi:3-deoxy-manno-octulosonate cytidylyltransferase (CMP-KDO synthetase)